MRIEELLNHIIVPVTNEESDILAQFEGATTKSKQDFSEREQVLVDQLINKDILMRRNTNGTIKYSKKRK
jgi:hypothetical protein